jgi:hypothetical protein
LLAQLIVKEKKMTLIEKIFEIYPELAQDVTVFHQGVIRLRNDLDEKGEYIEVWNHPTFLKPSQSQLAAME